MKLFPHPLYPIADPAGRPGRSHVALVEAMVSAGIRFLQLRVKHESTRAFIDIARAAKAVTDRAGAALIINDRADIARLVDAAGVHLGQDDLPPRVAREILGPAKLIGFSTHSPTQIEAAVRAGGIDYVAFGPIFPTRSKENPDPVQGLETLREVRRLCPLPLAAIGGITAANLLDVLQTADAVAVISAITDADDPEEATRRLLRLARAAVTRPPGTS